MKKMLIVLGFIIVCALLESPEDYQWTAIEWGQGEKTFNTVQHDIEPNPGAPAFIRT